MEKKSFSNETLNAAVAIINELQNEIDNLRVQSQKEPINETAQRYLMEKLSLTQSEAEEVCDGIQNGISEFNSQFAENSENGKVNLREKLEEAISKMREDKKIDYLSAILTALQVSQQTTMSTEQIVKLQEDNAKRPAEELINDIESLFGDNLQLDGLSEFVDNNIDVDAIIKLSHQIDMRKDDYRFLSAIMLYVGQHDGKIKLSDSGAPIPANLIGSLACAGIETISITGELKEGKIDLKRWQVILKWILGTLLACSLAYLALLALAYVAGSVIGLIFTLFGTGTIALIAALVISIFVCWDMGKYSVFGITSLLDILSSVYDQYLEPITQKIKNIATFVPEWFKSLFKKEEKSQSTTKPKEDIQDGPIIAQSRPVTI